MDVPYESGKMAETQAQQYHAIYRAEYDRAIEFFIAANRFGAARGRKNRLLAATYRAESNYSFKRSCEALRLTYAAMGEGE